MKELAKTLLSQIKQKHDDCTLDNTFGDECMSKALDRVKLYSFDHVTLESEIRQLFNDEECKHNIDDINCSDHMWVLLLLKQLLICGITFSRRTDTILMFSFSRIVRENLEFLKKKLILN